MSQFSLYKNNNRTTNRTYPYFVDVQNDLLDELNSRMIIPLTKRSALGNHNPKRLCPVIEIKNEEFVLLTQQMSSAPKSIFSDRVDSLSQYRYEILNAIDMLITGI